MIGLRVPRAVPSIAGRPGRGVAPSSVPPPRVHVVVARDADVAVVFRRGPAKWFHLLKWNLADDTIEPGAWFRGTLYWEKCDVSPDGQLLVSFVMQGNKSQTSYSHAWTAVSRLPWMAALGLWPQGTTYGGGGRFLAPRHLVLRTGAATPHPDHPGHGIRVETGHPELHSSSHEVEGATWSGRDRRGRLIYAKAGRLYRRGPRGEEREIADLCGLAPNPVEAPAWARAPLEDPRGGRRQR